MLRTTLAAFALIFCMAAPGLAQTVGAPIPSGWMAAEGSGCKVWNPQPQPGETVTWSGGCEGGFASGPGVTQWIEHGVPTEKVEGSRVAGHLQGRGVQTLANGDRYVGGWKDDQKDGPGSYTADNGMSYVGDFKEDQFDGQGTLTDARGNRYVGAWRNGRRNGQGTFTGADGSTFTGVWIDDEPVDRGDLL